MLPVLLLYLAAMFSSAILEYKRGISEGNLCVNLQRPCNCDCEALFIELPLDVTPVSFCSPVGSL